MQSTADALHAHDPNFAWTLWNAASSVPEKVAIVDRASNSTYAELCDRAAAIAGVLRTRNLSPGDRVAIFLERGADAAASFYAALACGAVAININETLRNRQIEHICSHADVACLVSTKALLDRLPRDLEIDSTIVLVETVGFGDAITPVSRVGADVAQIIYTSGSTGMPKGVTLTHSNLWAGVRSVSAYLEISADDRLSSLLPFSFDYGLNQLLCSVNAHAALIVERSPIPRQIVVTLRDLEATVLACVPPLWLQLLGTDEFEVPIPSLRAMTNTGGRIPVEAVRQLRRCQPHAKLYLMYGLTEAFRATYLDPSEVDAHPSSIGRAIPGSEILVLRDDGTPCDLDEPGELVQRGPTVAAGYWKDPELTAAVYRPNPLRPSGAPDRERVVFSGDVVRRDAQGHLYFIGRRDRIIKSLGVRVSPDEVASILHDSGEVLEAIVGTEPDHIRGDAVIAHVVLVGNGSLERLERFCRTEMPRYMQPTKIHVHEFLPRTPSGKFDLRGAEALIREGAI